MLKYSLTCLFLLSLLSLLLQPVPILEDVEVYSEQIPANIHKTNKAESIKKCKSLFQAEMKPKYNDAKYSLTRN